MTMERDLMLAPLRVDDADLPRRIREGLEGFGYRLAEIQKEIPEAMKTPGQPKVSQETLAGRLAPVRPLACLLRAFLLRAATAEGDLRRELGDAFFELCEEAGLWERVEGGVVGRVVIVLAENGAYVLADHTRTRLGEKEKYWVMAIGSSTMRVAHSIERRRYGRALDLCCGGGVQGFLVAGLADEVVGVDRNVRAVNLGRFAAAMNGMDHVKFRESDCYSAIEGEQFDLIACNPPYVITPDLQAYYRDGGLGGDRFTEKVLREAGAHLAEGGVMHVLCDVATIDEPSEKRIAQWVAGSGCDVLAVRDRPVLPAAYADRWLTPDENQTEEEREFEKHRWVKNLMDIGVESIENWLIVLRKRTTGGPNWFHIETPPSRTAGSFGHQIARLIRGQDLLRAGEAALWAAKLRVAADVRMHSVVRPEGGGWTAESARLTFSEGMIRDFVVDAGAASMLVHFDRERSAEMALRRIAMEMKRDVEGLRGELGGFVRHMVENGLLEAA